MKFLLISTHQLGSRSTLELDRLIFSLSEARGENEVDLFLVLQNAKPQDSVRIPAIAIGVKQTFIVPERVSLSRARNIALKNVVLSNYDFVLFPDDDCWYADRFFDFLKDSLNTNGTDLLFIRNGDAPFVPRDSVASEVTKPSLYQVMRDVNSNNIIVSAAIALKCGLFDEGLGLGTDTGGGEDSDYALRCYRISKSPGFIKSRIIGHRLLNVGIKVRLKEMSRYWPGVMLVTLKNLDRHLIPLAFYRISVGMYLVITGRMSLSRFIIPFTRCFGVKGSQDHRL